jgi:hypothetical protein
MIISLVIWFVFSKVQKISDPWAADFSKVVFFASVLVVLYGASEQILHSK